MENNFLSLIKTRRSVRAYKAEPVPPEALDAVLEAGTYAPTGGGRQSPTIIAITDPKYRQEIAKLNAEVMGSSTRPPTMVRLPWFWFWQMAVQAPLWRTEAASLKI